MINRSIQTIKITSSDHLDFFIEKEAVMFCEGLVKRINAGECEIIAESVAVVTLPYTGEILEVFLDYLFYKIRHINDDYLKLPPFKVGHEHALSLYTLANEFNI